MGQGQPGVLEWTFYGERKVYNREAAMATIRLYWCRTVVIIADTECEKGKLEEACKTAGDENLLPVCIYCWEKFDTLKYVTEECKYDSRMKYFRMLILIFWSFARIWNEFLENLYNPRINMKLKVLYYERKKFKSRTNTKIKSRLNFMI